MSNNNNAPNWLGGLIFCAFLIGIFVRSLIRPVGMELGGWALMVLFFITGINLIVTAIFHLEIRKAARAISGGIYGLSFGMVAILIGWTARTGWSGSLGNLIPDSWTQTIPRILFVACGIGCCALGCFSFHTAFRQWGQNNGEENGRARLAEEEREARIEAAWKADPKGQRGVFILLLIVILFTAGPGLVCLGTAAHSFFVTWQSQHWAQVQGVVTSVKVERSTISRPKGADRTVHQLLMDYDYSVAGKSYVGHRVTAGDSGDEAFEQASRYPAGTHVMVHYSPSDPASALLELRIGGAVLPVLTAGVIFSTIGATFIASLFKAWRLR